MDALAKLIFSRGSDPIASLMGGAPSDTKVDPYTIPLASSPSASASSRNPPPSSSSYGGSSSNLYSSSSPKYLVPAT
ncbi:hypothetical protein HK405_012477, partial [Cladochytrium tenue]